MSDEIVVIDVSQDESWIKIASQLSDDEDDVSLERFGGPGSGHHGHVGIPKHRGGSAKSKNKPVNVASDMAYSILLSASKAEEKVGKYTTLLPPSDEDGLVFDKRQTLHWYTGAGYKSINGFLRGVRESEEDSTTLDDVKLLDEMFDEAPELPFDVILYRGLQPNSRLSMKVKENSKALIGTIIENKGFTSTTRNEVTAINWATFTGEEDYMLWEVTSHIVWCRIVVPRGIKFIPIGGPESEILLDRDLKFIVKSVKKQPHPPNPKVDVQDDYILDLELVEENV